MSESYKVIKIIDDETILINAGMDDNIEVGDQFEIFETGEEIFDPDTQENLGTLDTIKETVEAINVLPKMCICKHIIKSTHSVFESGLLQRTEINIKSLNVDTSQISGGLSSDKKIRIGDKVRLA